MSADFFQNQPFQGTLTFRVLNCLDPDQDRYSVRPDRQQMTKVATSMERVRHKFCPYPIDD